jgi:hypothetical protein
MCPTTIFKVIWNYLIFRIPHYGNVHVFMHEITLHIYYGISTCWNILKCYELKEAGQLSMKYSILCVYTGKTTRVH